MKFVKRFTKIYDNVYNMFKYDTRSSVLRNPDGSVVFEMDNIETPVDWSQLATDILAQKYFRKTGVPQFDKKGNPIKEKDGLPKLGSETSAREVVHRLAGAWRHWGEKFKYFDTTDDAVAFYDELAFMLLSQMAAPNSPQWFNTGLAWAYNIRGTKQGHYYVDPETGEMCESEDAYTHPQPHACFIQSVNDDLVNEGGIFDLALREARIFKYGSGTGTNFSALRGEKEKLSGGGMSSGLMSFLKIFDRAAGAIKSGGTTRRAAKMVIVDIDHPDVEEFIVWKANEEEKVAALVAGSRINSTFLRAIVDLALKDGTDRKTNTALNDMIQRALHRGVPINIIFRSLALVDQGFTDMNFESYDTHYEGEAYTTISGQNSNNSIRVTKAFMEAVERDEMWELKWRRSGETARSVKARDLWKKINLSAWKCADPGLQYDTTINEWHTCPQSGRINASNPCSEYMFLDDTACNLASLNLMKFYDEEKSEFRIDDFLHAVRLWTVVLEISVLMAQFPSREMAQNSYDFRTLGLGYANLGSMLMVMGIPYDSPEALAIAGAISSIMTGQSYSTSAEMAQELGAFPKYVLNRNDMLRVIRNHRHAAYNSDESLYDGLTVKPHGINPKYCPEYLLESARKVWDEALEKGEQYGFRNAQTSVLAPTGTIGLVMDCDTTGIEPDFAIIKFKKLAGGGYFKIVNQSVRKALKKLGYSEKQITEIERYSRGNPSFNGCPHINRKSLTDKGFSPEKIDYLEGQLENVFDIRFAFNKWTLGEDFLKSIGITDEQLADPNFNLLAAIGFTKQEVDESNDFICGTMMIEGAPYLKKQHLPIFDTANRCGKRGTRYIPYMAHVRMMAAAQPFISGAISKTVNMPAEATVDDIGRVYMQSWKMMLKAIALYRDGSKLSQPLNAANIEDLDEVIMLGDENTLDETLGPNQVQERILGKTCIPQRRRLPKKRHGFVREAHVGGHKVYLRTGEYEDGSLGEIFIDMYKEGAAFKGLLNCFAVLVSKSLQYGVPLDEIVDTFIYTRFEPAGIVQGHEAIRNSTSILDYVFRSIGYDYLGRKDFVHVSAVDEIAADKNGKNGKHKNGDNHIDSKTDATDHSTTDIQGVEKEIDKLKATNETDNSQIEKVKDDQTKMRANDAKKIGYTGEQCRNCGSIRVKRNGSCNVCEDCGETSGCS